MAGDERGVPRERDTLDMEGGHKAAFEKIEQASRGQAGAAARRGR